MRRVLKGLARRAGIKRADVAAARMYAERHALASLPTRAQRTHGRILCYHSIGQPQSGVNDVAPARFRRHIELALSLGYRFAPAREIALNGGGPKDLAITFDDAWTSVAREAAPILREHKIPWSLFAVSDWSGHAQPWTRNAILDWRALDDLLDDDVELGSHSVTHADFGALSAEEAFEELTTSRRVIQERLGIAPTTFAIPLGQSANWTETAAKLAREAGYEVAYAQAEDTRPPDTVGRTFVTKFDSDRIFRALLNGAYDRWEEWY
jgi:peptidoglycan/xylan/chitin deacetylase (PgdA/CDA1 family)